MVLGAGLRFGPYDVLTLEGAGGMGEVYRARDTRLNRDVALKVLPGQLAVDAHAVARLRREAHVLASLNHPNIAAIYGLEERDGVHALVLELVEGCTLADRIARGPLPLIEAGPVALQIAQALAAAHDHGIVHRDLKPSNIKLRPDGTAKVLDFGLAKAIGPPDAGAPVDSPTITLPFERLVGTAAYMSPEQIRGQPVDHRTDIWAFGCVLFEMLTGRRAFAGLDGPETLAAVLTGTPDWSALPAHLPPSLAAFLRRSLEKDPARRLRDAGAVALALDGTLDTETVVVSASPMTPPRLRRRTLAVGAALIATALVSSLAVWTLAGPRERTLAFAIRAPEGSRFPSVTMEPYPALSPDGRYLAFVAARQSARRSIWVQEVGTLDARPLPGTEGGTTPFWSPDGQYVGFMSQGRPRRVAVSGDRPPQILCECPAESGGAWSAAGTIVFAGPSGLFRVPAGGGDAVPITRVDESRGEFGHRWPVMVPGDPNRFVYLVRSTRDEVRGLYLGSLGEPRLNERLTGDDANAAFGTGHDGRMYLFFVRDLALLAQPFDTARGRLVGEPSRISHPVRPGETGRLAPFAAGGRALVYRRAAASAHTLVWMTRRGVADGTLWMDGQEYRYPTISPDGTRVGLVLLDRQSGLRDLWVYDLQRGVADRLTSDPISVLFPLWMRDGRRLVFASARSGPWNLYTRSAIGGGQDELLYGAPSPAVKYPSDISADGRFLLFHDSRSTWLLPLDGERVPTLLTPGVQARISPNGRWLAYTALDAGERYVYVTTFPKPAERWRVSPGRGDDPQWRRDGRELFYIDREQTLVAVPIDPESGLAAGPSTPLFRAVFDTSGRTLGRAYAPSPDEQRFLVNERLGDDDYALWVTLNWVPTR